MHKQYISEHKDYTPVAAGNRRQSSKIQTQNHQNTNQSSDIQQFQVCFCACMICMPRSTIVNF
jgi:hypothetical protein